MTTIVVPALSRDPCAGNGLGAQWRPALPNTNAGGYGSRLRRAIAR
jgi:hypothetical protein